MQPIKCYHERIVDGRVVGRICKQTKLFVSVAECAKCRGEMPVVTLTTTSWLNISDKLESTLPPPKDTDRPIRFNLDGSIEYLDSSTNWEPPREVGNGWERDPENPLRFVPLWLPCADRNQKATRYANCGCVTVTLTCNNPVAKRHGHPVTHDICKSCGYRSDGTGALDILR